MNRSQRRANKAMRVSPAGSFADIPSDAVFLMVAICRAAVPSMPEGMFNDEDLVNSAFELIKRGYLDIWVTDVPDGFHIYTDLKLPGRGVQSTNGPVFLAFEREAA